MARKILAARVGYDLRIQGHSDTAKLYKPFETTFVTAGGQAPFRMRLEEITFTPVVAEESGGTYDLTDNGDGTADFSIDPQARGVWTVRVRTRDQERYIRYRTFTFRVIAEPMELSGLPLAAGTRGVAYSDTLTAAAGVHGYTLSSVTGLPAGLSAAFVDAYNIDITGTPTEAGSFSVVLTITDGAGTDFVFTAPLTVAQVYPVLYELVLPDGYTEGQVNLIGDDEVMDGLAVAGLGIQWASLSSVPEAITLPPGSTSAYAIDRSTSGVRLLYSNFSDGWKYWLDDGASQAEISHSVAATGPYTRLFAMSDAGAVAYGDREDISGNYSIPVKYESGSISEPDFGLDPDQYTYVYVRSISADGTTAGGYVYDNYTGRYQPLIWNATDGAVILSFPFQSDVRALSSDGNSAIIQIYDTRRTLVRWNRSATYVYSQSLIDGALSKTSSSGSYGHSMSGNGRVYLVDNYGAAPDTNCVIDSDGVHPIAKPVGAVSFLYGMRTNYDGTVVAFSTNTSDSLYKLYLSYKTDNFASSTELAIPLGKDRAALAGMSRDGTYIVANLSMSLGGVTGIAVYETATGTVVASYSDNLPGESAVGSAVSVDENGRIIAYNPAGSKAFARTLGGSWTLLFTTTDSYVLFNDLSSVSSSGFFIAMTGGQSRRYAEDGSYTQIPVPPGYDSIYAYKISQSGTHVAGDLVLAGAYTPFVWTEADGVVEIQHDSLDDPGANVECYTYAFNYDGSLIIGEIYDLDIGFGTACLWTLDNGIVFLAELEDGVGREVASASNDVSVLGVSGVYAAVYVDGVETVLPLPANTVSTAGVACYVYSVSPDGTLAAGSCIVDNGSGEQTIPVAWRLSE